MSEMSLQRSLGIFETIEGTRTAANAKRNPLKFLQFVRISWVRPKCGTVYIFLVFILSPHEILVRSHSTNFLVPIRYARHSCYRRECEKLNLLFHADQNFRMCAFYVRIRRCAHLITFVASAPLSVWACSSVCVRVSINYVSLARTPNTNSIHYKLADTFSVLSFVTI